MQRALVLLGLVVLALVGALWRLSGTGASEDAPVAAGGPPRAAAERSPAAEEPAATEPAPRASEGRRAVGEPAHSGAVGDGETGRFVRVLDEASGEPVGELALRVVALGAPDAEDGREPERARGSARTDASGRADVAELVDDLAHLPAEDRAEVAFLAVTCAERAELELLPRRLPLDRLGAVRERAFVLRARPRPVAPVRGLVVDAESGEPVADYPLRLVGWTEPADARPATQRRSFPFHAAEWATTDAGGRFATRHALPAGRVELVGFDAQELLGEHALDAGGRAHEDRYEVEAGPRILLDFDPPGGRAHSDFVAGLWRAPRELVHDDGVTELPSPWSPDGGGRTGPWGNAVAVRGEPVPWVRLTPEAVRDAPVPTEVFVLSRDGRVFGHATVEDLERHATEPVRVELDERHALAGVIVWPEDEPRVRNAYLALSGAPVVGSPDADGLVVGAPDANGLVVGAPDADGFVVGAPDADGFVVGEPVADGFVVGEPVADGLVVGAPDDDPAHRYADRAYGAPETPFAFQYLEAGDYELEVAGDGAVPWRRAVEVPGAGPVRVVLEAEERGPNATVRGCAVTRSGLPLDGRDGRAHLHQVWLSGRGAHLQSGPLEWEGGRAAFVLEDVPPGSYRPVLRWKRGALALVGGRSTLELPPHGGDVLELVVADDVPVQEFEVRVIEPEDPGRLGVQMELGPGSVDHASLWFGGVDDPEAELVTLPDGRRAAVRALGPLPAETRFTLELDLEGYREPELGNEAFGPPDARGVRVAEIVPVRGWSARVTVYEGQDEVPGDALEGIVLTFDEVAAPATDATGEVYVEAPGKPARLGVLTPGWTLSDRASYDEWGSLRASDGAFTVEDGELTVHLKRVE